MTAVFQTTQGEDLSQPQRGQNHQSQGHDLHFWLTLPQKQVTAQGRPNDLRLKKYHKGNRWKDLVGKEIEWQTISTGSPLPTMHLSTSIQIGWCTPRKKQKASAHWSLAWSYLDTKPPHCGLLSLAWTIWPTAAAPHIAPQTKGRGLFRPTCYVAMILIVFTVVVVVAAAVREGHCRPRWGYFEYRVQSSLSSRSRYSLQFSPAFPGQRAPCSIRRMHMPNLRVLPVFWRRLRRTSWYNRNDIRVIKNNCYVTVICCSAPL